MQLEVSRVEKSFLRATFPPLPVLSIFLNITLVVWTPSAKAQVSSFENAGGGISGTALLEADKRPATQVAVSLKSRATGIFRSVLTDLEGHFKVQNLPRGTYDIAVEEEGYEAAQTSAQLDGPSAKLVVYLKSRAEGIRSSRYSVSVRELKIPGKAQDEFQKGVERVGEALTQLNRLDEAEKSAREALLRNPNFAGAYLALADVQERRGGYRAEIQDLDTYLKLQPNGPRNEQARHVREAAARKLAITDSQDRISPKQQ
jgi:tetratricopeptide (TPR) repeat protein